MKIGILTFHRALNYGAVLQCYALYKTLCSLGHDVEIIDYRPPYLEKYRKFVYRKTFKEIHGFIGKLKYIIFCFRSYRGKKRSSKLFDDFLNKTIKLSSIVHSAEDVSSKYDAVFFGSDQIWNPKISEGFDPLFYGQYAKGNTKFISYAASLGTPQNIDAHQWPEINTYLKNFDFLSVREEKLTDYLSDIGKEIKTVLDPTLLASREIFDCIAVKPMEEKYVLLYMLEADKNAVAFAKRIARERGCPLIRITAGHSLVERGHGYETKPGVSVGEFIGFFKYADYVINISFHGTAFSVIYNKDFYTLKSRNYERSYGLLKNLDLLDRFVCSGDEIEIKPVDYDSVCLKLNKLKSSSFNFIRKSLNS
jgi:hypothetical protein